MLDLFTSFAWFKKRKKRKAAKPRAASRPKAKKKAKKRTKKTAGRTRSKQKRVIRSPSTGRKVRTVKTVDDLDRFEQKLMGQLYDPKTGELGRMATPAERKRQLQNPDGYIQINGRKMLVI